MTRRCSGTTKDGTRCLNRGQCPHHSGSAGAPRHKATKPSRQTTADSQSWEQEQLKAQPKAPVRQQVAEANARDHERMEARAKQRRYDEMQAMLKRQRARGQTEMVWPSQYEEFFDGPGKIKPRPVVPAPQKWPPYDPAKKSTVKDTKPKPRWEQYGPSQSWKTKKRLEDMTPQEFNAYRKEMNRGSRELSDLWDKGHFVTFFRTLFRGSR